MKLRIGPDLALPLETVTQSIAFIAKRRAGKSYAARRLAEQLLQSGQQVVIVDPKGDHWGIRSSRDGKSPGFPVVILGGERGDIPLEVGAGELVAKMVAQERLSVLLDLSLFRKHEVATFMTAFLENLYRLKAHEAYRTPMMLMIDEADAIAPQKPAKGEERMLGAAEDIVRRGGQRGLGCTLITQRSAVLNKNVLTQSEVLILLRTIAPQDLDALDAWVDAHGTREERAKVRETLPALPIGDAWIWSPGWPTSKGLFQRVHILPIDTFDSGSTPKPGERRAEPKNLADVDLGLLRKQMAATIERAKAEDPRELRKEIAHVRQLTSKRIAELESELAKTDQSPPKVEIREVAVLKPTELVIISRAAAAADSLQEKVRALHDLVQQRLMLPKWAADHRVHPPASTTARLPVPVAPRQAVKRPTLASANGNALGPAERAFLTVLAHRQGKLTGRNQLAVIAGYSAASGHVDNTLSTLRSAGYAKGGRSSLEITDDGLQALGELEPLPTGAALVAHWCGQLDPAARKMLQTLVDIYPRTMTRDELAEAAGYSPSSGHVDNTLSKLRTRELVTGGRAELRASEELFS